MQTHKKSSKVVVRSRGNRKLLLTGCKPSAIRLTRSEDLKYSIVTVDNTSYNQTTAQLHSSHRLAKQCSKFSKPGFNST